MLEHKSLPVMSFEDSNKFYEWLRQNQTQTTGFWLRYYKVNSDIKSIKHPDAVDIALCWGWIDGLINKYDEISYLVRFTPRGKKSIWSKVNVAKVEKLIESGLMQPAGLKLVNEAKLDGRWELAYKGQSTMEVPDDFVLEIKKNKKAYEKFKTFKKSELYSIGFALSQIIDKNKRIKKIESLIEKIILTLN
jgi:uncharacterized protein YdeI (YjbR/CyaY-like superfamily)